MNPVLRIVGQIVLYGLFAAAIGYFSSAPAYNHLAPDQALVRVSLTHTAQHKGECRQRSDEELAKLPPNMRIREECPRERADVVIEVDMDDARLYRGVLRAAGLAHDGSASVYKRFVVPAGEHEFEVRLSDRADGVFDYSAEKEVTLAPAQVFVVDFNAAAGGFIFRR